MRNRENPLLLLFSNKPLKAFWACKCKNNAIQPTQHRMFHRSKCPFIQLFVYLCFFYLFCCCCWNFHIVKMEPNRFLLRIYLFSFISIIFKTIHLFKQMYRCFPTQACRVLKMNDAILIPSKNKRVYKKGQYFFSANIYPFCVVHHRHESWECLFASHFRSSPSTVIYLELGANSSVTIWNARKMSDSKFLPTSNKKNHTQQFDCLAYLHEVSFSRHMTEVFEQNTECPSKFTRSISI